MEHGDSRVVRERCYPHLDEEKKSYTTNLHVVNTAEQSDGPVGIQVPKEIADIGTEIIFMHNKCAIYYGEWNEYKSYNVFSLVSKDKFYYLSTKLIGVDQGAKGPPITDTQAWTPAVNNHLIASYVYPWSETINNTIDNNKYLVKYNDIIYRYISTQVDGTLVKITPDMDPLVWTPVCFVRINYQIYAFDIWRFTTTRVETYSIYYNLSSRNSPFWENSYLYSKDDIVMLNNGFNYLCLQDIKVEDLTIGTLSDTTYLSEIQSIPVSINNPSINPGGKWVRVFILPDFQIHIIGKKHSDRRHSDRRHSDRRRHDDSSESSDDDQPRHGHRTKRRHDDSSESSESSESSDDDQPRHGRRTKRRHDDSSESSDDDQPRHGRRTKRRHGASHEHHHTGHGHRYKWRNRNDDDNSSEEGDRIEHDYSSEEGDSTRHSRRNRRRNDTASEENDQLGHKHNYRRRSYGRHSRRREHC